MGSNTYPTVAEKLNSLNAKVYVFHALNPYMKIQDLWFKHGYMKSLIINTGGSVTIGGVALSIILGFKDISCCGFDFMVRPDKTYADGIAGTSVTRNYFNVQIGDKQVLTCASFMSFAKQMLNIIKTAEQNDSINTLAIYGDSLAKELLIGLKDDYIYHRDRLSTIKSKGAK